MKLNIVTQKSSLFYNQTLGSLTNATITPILEQPSRNPNEQFEHAFRGPHFLGSLFLQTKYLNHPNTMPNHRDFFAKMVTHIHLSSSP